MNTHSPKPLSHRLPYIKCTGLVAFRDQRINVGTLVICCCCDVRDVQNIDIENTAVGLPFKT